MITGVLAVLLGEAARSRFLLWSSEFAQDRAAPGVVSLVSSEGDAVTQTDIRDQRGSGPRSEGEKICHIVERRPGQGALRQGRHGLPVVPAVADVRRLRRPRPAEPPLRRG
jgi:hypothetical protein